MEAIAVPMSAPHRAPAQSGPALLRDRVARRCWLRAGLLTLTTLIATAGDAGAQPAFPAGAAPVQPPAMRQVEPERRRLADPPQNPVTPAAGVVRPEEPSAQDLLNQPLADVIVEGNPTIPAYAILGKVRSRPGRPTSPKMVQDDVQELHNTRWFFSVRPQYRPSSKGPILVFVVIEKPIVRSVQFKGNKKIKTTELQQNTGLTPTHAFDVAANLESVQRIKALYMEKGYRFAEVSLESGSSPNDRDVIFVINEGPKVKIVDIDFEGNKFSSDQYLQTKITSKTVKLWIIQGEYDPLVIQNDALALKQYYMSLGFFDVEVNSAETFSTDKSQVTVTFQITEGQRYKIGNIDVIGNDVIARESLLADLEMESGEFFNERFLREDVNKMTGQYDEQGRMFAKVIPTPHFREGNAGWVDLTYNIDEDVVRYIGAINVHIRGDFPHTREDIVRQQINKFVKPGMLASSSDLRMARQRLAGSAIWDQTQPPVFDIKPTDGQDYYPAQLARGQSADLDERVLAAAGVRDIDLNELFGHSVTPISWETARPGHVSLPDAAPAPLAAPPRQLRGAAAAVPFAEQEMEVEAAANDVDWVFRSQSPDDIQYRPQSINQYGLPVPQDYMQGVSPQGDPFGDALSAPAPGFVDVNIDVSEGRTGRLMFGVGVNSDAGVVGSITLQEDNFNILRPPTSFQDIINGTAWRGAGQSFRIEAVPGTQVSRYVASWQDPFFLGTDFSFGVSGFYYNRFFRQWTEDRLGGRLSLGYVLNRWWSISSALRLENVQMRDFPTVGAPPDLDAVRGDNFLSTASATLSYDTRDNSFLPTEGHFLSLGYEQGFGEFNYPRFDIGAGKYFTTYQRPDGFGKHILAFSGQLGWTGDNTPIFERYYAGGYSSFRAFAFRGVTPREMGYEVGGNFMATGTAEYMVPVTADDNIRVVLFSDFGTVEDDIGFDQFRASAGFGFRVSLPALGQAPLAFDFAWPLIKEDFDRLRVFSFYVGFVR